MVEFNGAAVGAIVLGGAIALRFFFFLSPVIQGNVTMAQLIVAALHKRAQRATYLAHAADTAVTVYCTERSEDRSCPKSLWMEVCGK